jgi:hypothetical protein
MSMGSLAAGLGSLSQASANSPGVVRVALGWQLGRLGHLRQVLFVDWSPGRSRDQVGLHIFVEACQGDTDGVVAGAFVVHFGASGGEECLSLLTLLFPAEKLVNFSGVHG